MAASDSPPVGLDHPTTDPEPHTGAPGDDRSDSCACIDCGYTVRVDGDLPLTCPECGGALQLVTP